MADVDPITLMISIQAVNERIRKFEELLTSETLRDREEIESLVFSYEKTLNVLKEAYQQEWREGSNLPKYSILVNNDPLRKL